MIIKVVNSKICSKNFHTFKLAAHLEMLVNLYENWAVPKFSKIVFPISLWKLLDTFLQQRDS